MKVISIGMFVPGNQPVVWRGPMLHRALQQFLADVFWGDLDVLLLDLPPGTGRHRDLASAQLLPTAEILVVTTPQRPPPRSPSAPARSRCRPTSASSASIENMCWLELPDGTRMDVFGSGGGQRVAESLTRSVGADVPLLGQVPIDVTLREGGDVRRPRRARPPRLPRRGRAARRRPRLARPRPAAWPAARSASPPRGADRLRSRPFR